MNTTITAVVLTHNDEVNIVDCLDSLNFVDEILVIDDDSDDRTVELAAQYTRNIKKHSLNGNFASQRNYAFNYVHSHWILFIDSDEIVSKKLADEIQRKIQTPGVDGFYMKRIDYMWGKPMLHGEAGSVKLLRLARKDTGKWRGKIHEVWIVQGETNEMINPLIHMPHQSVREFISEVDTYSTLRADELKEEGKKTSVFEVICYPIGKFFLNYLLKQGYKDGVPGFIYAMIMSFHSFLVRGKLYQIQKK